MKLEQYKAEKPFAQKHLLTLMDWTPDEIRQSLALGLKLKAQLKAGIPHRHLEGKTLGMIFTKSSTRTRVSFEVGAVQMGCYPLFLSGNDIQLGRGETIHDTAKVLSRMLSGIMIRTFKQSDVEDLAKFGSIPIINGLTDLVHPCQVLADMQTFYEHCGEFEGKKLAYFGDGNNNMCHSLMVICAKLGVDFAAACPKEYQPDPAILAACQGYAKDSGSEILITDDPVLAAKGSSVLYADVWASMGQEAEFKERMAVMEPFRVTQELMDAAADDVIFLHCLPAHRGEEVTAEVIDGPKSVIFDEAENRLHAQKAVMALVMSGKTYEDMMA